MDVERERIDQKKIEERNRRRDNDGYVDENGVDGGDGSDGRAAGGTRNLEEWEIWP